MADEISPTIEAEPEVEVEAQPEVTEQMSEEAQLLETLKAASISKPEQLDGAIRNARRTFDMQSERDKLATQLDRMSQEVAELKSKPAQPQPAEVDDYGQPLDFAGEVRKAIRAEKEEERRQQAMIQEQQMKSWNSIQSDADFKLVESIWNEKLKDPNFVWKVQSGQVDPVLEYHETKSQYFKGLMKSAVGTIETLSKGGAPQPHLESGDARTPTMPDDEETTESEKILKDLQAKVESGTILSEDEELAAIQASLFKP